MCSKLQNVQFLIKSVVLTVEKLYTISIIALSCFGMSEYYFLFMYYSIIYILLIREVGDSSGSGQQDVGEAEEKNQSVKR